MMRAHSNGRNNQEYNCGDYSPLVSFSHGKISAKSKSGTRLLPAKSRHHKQVYAAEYTMPVNCLK
jgi:hypothetical protein